ncbi:SSI family serine proteinase inhibitor [Actinomadura terrae]|uniref:SSI family serine proteinase inhibitor n=1 Tax=Actinomadura terrae TaxID=604353 RepID=UPI001FA6C502|nr:SSI family serine proteinase inhibitor [Actinomadura terrae]
MTGITLRTILGSALLAGGIGAMAPAATAAEVPHTLTRITLSVVPEPGTPGAPKHVVLTCDPVSPLPHAQEACDELDLAFGDVARVPPRHDEFCFQVRQPVTASATGWWRGVQIQPYSEIITNDSCARIAHGHVFAF